MGLMDVLNGMQNGPHGQRTPGSGSGGMSPITMALLALLAYKAVKSFSGNHPGAAPAGTAASPGANPGSQGGHMPWGGLGDIFKGGLGGLLASGTAGSMLSGGLNDLLKQFEQNGQGQIANSWVGSGPNKAITPNDLASALGEDRIKTLMTYSGMSRDELLNGLSQHLPNLIDQLTPNGRLPTEQEAARLI